MRNTARAPTRWAWTCSGKSRAAPEEFALFKDCIESLLGRDAAGGGGFRGMQSKSLVDLIQLECLSQSSSVLRITQGAGSGKIWMQDGEIIDAATGDFNGEEAFKEILSWKNGNFEILPAEPDRPRTITNSYQGLLLDSAQAMDEWRGQQAGTGGWMGAPPRRPIPRWRRWRVLKALNSF